MTSTSQMEAGQDRHYPQRPVICLLFTGSSAPPPAREVRSSSQHKPLDIVRSHPLHLILSDINMPNLDGLGLLAELKGAEQWRNLPVVMITTEGSEEKVGQAIRLGSAAYIRKPFTAEQIQEKIGAIL